MVPLSWAAALLEQLPDLRQTRFRLVPARMSEEVFWARYFGAVFAILAEALDAAAPDAVCMEGSVEAAAAPGEMRDDAGG
mmetsp:Transcript_46598/g.94063  ORF Transcript_46598/g.94063 Transcript_46598/m.94063 type:complete len:80 (-) Transcript_46598:65-304(-)